MFYNPLIPIYKYPYSGIKKGATCFKLSCFIGIVSLYVIIKRFFPYSWIPFSYLVSKRMDFL